MRQLLPSTRMAPSRKVNPDTREPDFERFRAVPPAGLKVITVTSVPAPISAIRLLDGMVTVEVHVQFPAGTLTVSPLDAELTADCVLDWLQLFAWMVAAFASESIARPITVTNSMDKTCRVIAHPLFSFFPPPGRAGKTFALLWCTSRQISTPLLRPGRPAPPVRRHRKFPPRTAAARSVHRSALRCKSAPFMPVRFLPPPGRSHAASPPPERGACLRERP